MCMREIIQLYACVYVCNNVGIYVFICGIYRVYIRFQEGQNYDC